MLDNSLGLYIHIPFCKKKCAYCDFYSGFPTEEIQEAYVKTLIKELKKWGGLTDRPVNTVYFGGGTPSCLKTDDVLAVLLAVYGNFNVTKNAEITFEVNPDTVDFDYLKAIKKGGINRLSIGFQSSSDSALKLLGRTHTFSQSVGCFNNARRAGFNNISLDIMLALPEEKSSLDTTLKAIGGLSPEHISAYMLSYEENTALYKKKELLPIKNDDEYSQEYLKTCSFFEKQGYIHYEVSNFCKAGYESKHNSRYWQGKEYIGFGPSAYSFFGGKRFHYNRNLQEYIKNPTPVYDEEGGGLFEYIMLNLRLKNGINNSVIKENFGKTFSNVFIKKANFLSELGLTVFNGENLYLTNQGMLVSNSIITEFISEEFYENL